MFSFDEIVAEIARGERLGDRRAECRQDGNRLMTPVGLGYGVTAFSVGDAEQLLARAGLPRDWVGVVEDVDVSGLDPSHVLPNLGGVTFRGVWYPALNL